MNLARSRSTVAMLLAIVVVGLAPAEPAAALESTSLEECFYEAINADRALTGADSLEFDVGLLDYARTHSNAMSDADVLFHSTSAQLAAVLPDGWTRWGENVGWASGGDVCARLHAGFMSSSGHRANILNAAFTRVVVGVLIADGTTWVTVVFYTHPDPLRTGLPPFLDDDGSIHELDIIALADSGVTNGCGPGLFCPDHSLTRGEMAAFLVRALAIPSTGADYFTDDNGPFEPDINAIAAAGITNGCGPGLFCPDAPLSRGEMAAFLVRALELGPSSIDHFSDDSGLFESEINSVAAAGITQGCGVATFCPLDDVSRAQMASFLVRALGL